jgi:hypothetical protein
MDNNTMRMFSLMFGFEQYGYITIVQKLNKVSLKSLCDKIELPKRKTLIYTRIHGFL